MMIRAYQNGSSVFSKDKNIIQIKIVYWGPGESGKTTNYHRLKERFSNQRLSTGLSIETTDGRTLWNDSIYIAFDFPVGDKEYSIIAQIVTCTGQERFLPTREFVLGGADGVVFVADSALDKQEDNKRSYRELIEFTRETNIPFIIQLNKRDISNAISVDDFKNLIGLPKVERYEDGTFVIYPAVASKGTNVINTFWDLVLVVLIEYFSGKKSSG